MKIKRNIIEIDEKRCNGCGQCVSACAEGAIRLVNGKARLVADNYCDGLAACIGECPEGALKIVERVADAFDPEAVEKYLEKQREETSMQRKNADTQPLNAETLPCGCPSTQIQMFASACEGASRPIQHADIDSSLTHWPVQIRLIPPSAPFLKGADLLVASDCTPVAYPLFHKDFLMGKTVMMGCPKFDDAEEYIAKFADIFSVANIKSVTALIMEVPCCSKMPMIIERAMAVAGKKIPFEIITVGTRGKILKKESVN